MWYWQGTESDLIGVFEFKRACTSGDESWDFGSRSMGTGFCNFNRLGWDTQTPISPPLHSIKVEREDEGVISNRPEPGSWVSTLAGGCNPCYWGIIYRIRTRFPVDVKQTTGTEDVSIFSLSTRRNMGSTDYDKTILYRLISKYLISDTVLSLSTVTRRNLDRITFWIFNSSFVQPLINHHGWILGRHYKRPIVIILYSLYTLSTLSD